MKVVALSDTHGNHRGVDVPDGDVLVHSGDLTDSGSLDELEDFNDWLGSLPHEHKIVIAGNHDFCFEDKRLEAEEVLSNAVYLQDSGFEVDGVKFWGSPWNPELRLFSLILNLDTGFMVPEKELGSKWDLIPSGVDVLLTHTPPRGIGDQTFFFHHKIPFLHVGSKGLRKTVEDIEPSYHVFGHLHPGRGKYEKPGTTFVNASIKSHVQDSYEPIVFEI